MAFKLPFKWPQKSPKGFVKKTDGTQQEVKTLNIPWFSKQSFDRQLRILGGLLLLFLFIAAAFTYIDTRDTSYGSRYVSETSKLLMLSQKLAKDAAASFSGDSAAFEGLQATRTEFSSILQTLDKGNESLPRTEGMARASLDNLLSHWKRMTGLLDELEKGRPLLVTLE